MWIGPKEKERYRERDREAFVEDMSMWLLELKTAAGKGAHWRAKSRYKALCLVHEHLQLTSLTNVKAELNRKKMLAVAEDGDR